MSPAAFGFDENKLNDDVTIICARAGSTEAIMNEVALGIKKQGDWKI